MRPMPFLSLYRLPQTGGKGRVLRNKPGLCFLVSVSPLFSSLLAFLYITSAIISRFLDPWLPPTADPVLSYKAWPGPG